MPDNRFDFGKSILDDDERPISGQPTREDFVKALKGYLTSMQERWMDITHPNMEFLTNGFLLILKSQGPSVTTPLEHATLEDTVRNVVKHEMQAVWQPLAQVQQRLEEHSCRHTVKEINSRQYQVSQRDRDRKWRINAFNNKAHRFHAADLFDIESMTHDIFKHVSNLSSSLAA